MPGEEELKAPPPPSRDRDDAGRYIYTWDEDGIRAVLESVTRRRYELWSLVSIQLKRPGGTITPVARVRFNFRSASAPEGMARRLKGMVGDYSWLTRLSHIGAALDADHSAGDEPVDLGAAPEPPEEQYLARPFLETGQHTILFAEGGTTKSLFGLAISEEATGASILPGVDFDEPIDVLYLDWESDLAVFKRRHTKLMIGSPKPAKGRITYKRMTAPLTESADEIEYLHRSVGAKLTVCDSALLACGGLIKDEDAVANFYAACRPLGTVLTIAHITKASNGDMPVGSQAWYTQARSCWYIAKEQHEGEPEVKIALLHRKSNNDQLSKPVGFRIDFSDGAIRYYPHNPAASPDIEGKLKPRPRIVALLTQMGAMATKEIAEELGLTAQAVSNAMRSGRGKVFVRLGSSQPYRWGILEDSRSSEHEYTRESTADTSHPPPSGGRGNGYTRESHTSEGEDVKEGEPW
tara:strand:+ start:1047 stop:2441 length:1395 start_codon:yes stop_codon:yes gene_type:complete